MTDEDPDQETEAPRPGRLAGMAVRAIDAGRAVVKKAGLVVINAGQAVFEAGLGGLQRLRLRIEPAVAEEEGDQAGRRRNRSGKDQPDAVEVSVPARKTLLHRFLIIVMCLLIGGVAAMLVSYRGFSKQLDLQSKHIDYMQDELKQSKKDEARNLGEKRQLQRDIKDYEEALREARQEIEEYKDQIAELNTRLPAARGTVRPTDRGRSVPRPATAQPGISPKTGTCVTGSTNPAGDLLDCIGKFNRQ